jgi:hypothetical protein
VFDVVPLGKKPPFGLRNNGFNRGELLCRQHTIRSNGIGRFNGSLLTVPVERRTGGIGNSIRS